MSAEAETTRPGKMRPTHFSGANAVCPVCGATFLKTRSWKEFCGDKCRKAFHKNSNKAGVDFSIRKAFTEIKSELSEIKSMLKDGRPHA